MLDTPARNAGNVAMDAGNSHVHVHAPSMQAPCLPTEIPSIARQGMQRMAITIWFFLCVFGCLRVVSCLL